jgi:hypothetical protein
LLAEQAPGSAPAVLVDEDGSVLGWLNLVGLDDGATALGYD